MIWGPLYRCIYNANVIINGVPEVTDGTKEKRDEVMAEAKVIRANNYLELLTVFAKAYDPAISGNRSWFTDGERVSMLQMKLLRALP